MKGGELKNVWYMRMHEKGKEDEEEKIKKQTKIRLRNIKIYISTDT